MQLDERKKEPNLLCCPELSYTQVVDSLRQLELGSINKLG